MFSLQARLCSLPSHSSSCLCSFHRCFLTSGLRRPRQSPALRERHPLAHLWHRYPSQEEKASTSVIICVIVATLSVSVASGSWLRSPGCANRKGRLRREPTPPPPPPPEKAPGNGGDNDGEDANDEGEADEGGDGNPQQEAAGENDRDGDGNATGEAPALEDPPPPPGGVEQEDGEDDSVNDVSDAGLHWLLLLLMAHLVMGLWIRNTSIVNTKSLSTSKPRSAIIPGLLERQIQVVDGDLMPVAAAPSPPSFMAGLLQRRTPPVPPAYKALNVTPPPPQQVWDAPAPRASNSPGPLPRQTHRLLWSRTYMFLLALPGLAILTTVVGLILPLRDAFEAIPERIFVPPPPPPPAPPAPPPPPPPPVPPSRQEAGAKLVSPSGHNSESP